MNIHSIQSLIFFTMRLINLYLCFFMQGFVVGSIAGACRFYGVSGMYFFITRAMNDDSCCKRKNKKSIVSKLNF